MKKNNKTNKIVVLSVIGLILTITIIIFILNYTKDSSSLSILEKNWINNNSNIWTKWRRNYFLILRRIY